MPWCYNSTSAPVAIPSRSGAAALNVSPGWTQITFDYAYGLPFFGVSAVSGPGVYPDVAHTVGPAVAVEHRISRYGHGVRTVTTAGTDVPLVTSSTPARTLIIQAQTDNTGAIAVGGLGVDATVATGTGVLLAAGEMVTLAVDDLADVYIDATVSTDGVRYTYGA